MKVQNAFFVYSLVSYLISGFVQVLEGLKNAAVAAEDFATAEHHKRAIAVWTTSILLYSLFQSTLRKMKDVKLSVKSRSFMVIILTRSSSIRKNKRTFLFSCSTGPEAATGGFASGRRHAALVASRRRKSTSRRHGKLRQSGFHQNRNGAVRARP